MIGAHDQHPAGPFSITNLFLTNWKQPEHMRKSRDEIEESWLKILESDSVGALPNVGCTPIRPSIHSEWSPSMETPKTLGSIDNRLREVTMTSPALLFSSTPKRPLVLSDEEETEGASTLMGFCTGAGNRIKTPSKEALDKSNQMMMSAGFTTGSGKKIVVNESKKNIEIPLKQARLHAVLEETNCSRLSWKDALKCRPCVDIDNAVLSGIPISICKLNCQSAVDFCFSTIGFPPWDVASAYEDLQSINGVKRELLSFPWVQNHFRWVVIKAASLARSFPNLFASFTPNEILRQLHMRYISEYVKCKRSSLKKIIERDDASSKPMVLFIAQILCENEVEVSDGWYSIKARLDQPLSELVKSKAIKEGIKIITVGANLTAGEGIPALEAKDSSLRLLLSYNSTRRAKRFERLGLYDQLMMIDLKSVKPDGGRVSGIEVIIERKYPVCYLVDNAQGKTTMSAREYEKMVDKFESSPSHSQLERLQNSRVSAFLRFRVKSKIGETKAILTLWNPESMDILPEGSSVRMFGLAIRPSLRELNLQTTKGSRIVSLQDKPILTRNMVFKLPESNFEKELDFTGLVSSEPVEANDKTMSIFLSDSDGKKLCILILKRYYETLPKLRALMRTEWRDLLLMHYDQTCKFAVYSFKESSALRVISVP